MTVQTRDFQAKRQVRGALAYRTGAMAEEQVARQYESAGYTLCERRFRSARGEIDLIFRQGACTVFVEVKKSLSFETAALRLDRRQMDRICATACDYCESLPDGLLSEMRFDLAMVDAQGRIEVFENAFGEA
ncbi:YraN family protein [Paracoccus sp. TK19116]|uniref:UPF0102 protein MLD63_09215 n=1 Tax=Paracoccus albicereus TaxID=2922394 RepID=A0ABT1MQW8_9RHOB|nr:YraN family protein [Paracoccus albicereus]MCQ0970601.1 YraN family protein [Paracoccus albicereus]